MRKKHHSFCGSADHPSFSRRSLLAGTAAGAAAFAADMSRLECFSQPAFAEELKKKNKSVILLWLAGGASQLETWDPKPGRETGGPFASIQTSVSGVRISELMPKMATRLHRNTALIRSLNTRDGGHGGGSQLMIKGRRDEANVK